jgi:very-long-chain (3R)-3-hydroxyacyl-CoA dehydratase
MQVASRYLLVWGIVNNFPTETTRSIGLTTMLMAWSTTEIIRYSYFAINLAYGQVPSFLTWLRYNTFFLLYPMGISSECWLVWLSKEPGKKWNPAYEWFVWAVLAIYVPGKWY